VVAEFLIENGADINNKVTREAKLGKYSETPISYVLSYRLGEGNEFYKYLIAKKPNFKLDNIPFVSLAILSNDLERVKDVLKAGADPNCGGENYSSPLFILLRFCLVDRSGKSPIDNRRFTAEATKILISQDLNSKVKDRIRERELNIAEYTLFVKAKDTEHGDCKEVIE